MQGRRHRQGPGRSGDLQILDAGLDPLHASDLSCAELEHLEGPCRRRGGGRPPRCALPAQGREPASTPEMPVAHAEQVPRYRSFAAVATKPGAGASRLYESRRRHRCWSSSRAVRGQAPLTVCGGASTYGGCGNNVDGLLARPIAGYALVLRNLGVRARGAAYRTTHCLGWALRLIGSSLRTIARQAPTLGPASARAYRVAPRDHGSLRAAVIPVATRLVASVELASTAPSVVAMNSASRASPATANSLAPRRCGLGEERQRASYRPGVLRGRLPPAAPA